MIKSQLTLAVILVSFSIPALADWAPILGTDITSDNDHDVSSLTNLKQKILLK